jgi:hypothetical protein
MQRETYEDEVDGVFGEGDLVEALLAALDDSDNQISLSTSGGEDIEIAKAQSFADAMLLTNDDGIVLRLKNGQIFHLIVKGG